jgi:hypothetical protein
VQRSDPIEIAYEPTLVKVLIQDVRNKEAQHPPVKPHKLIKEVNTAAIFIVQHLSPVGSEVELQCHSLIMEKLQVSMAAQHLKWKGRWHIGTQTALAKYELPRSEQKNTKYESVRNLVCCDK